MWVNRLQELRKALVHKGLDGMYISSYENYRYFSGFTGSNCHLLITAGQSILITDGRYTQQAQEQTEGFEIVTQRRSAQETLADWILRLRLGRVGYETMKLTDYEIRSLRGACGGVDWIPQEDFGLEYRICKDEAELACIQKAVDIADTALSQLVERLAVGMTEREIAAELEYLMAKNGSEHPAFETISASGPRGALPHGAPTDRRVQDGEMLTLDFGACYHGYHSDITRTLWFGKPEAELLHIWNVVYEAQQESIAAIRPGMKASELDLVHRDVYRRYGYQDKVAHSLGHGVGLEIHEEPRISARCDTVLEPGMVITVEPGLYFSGLGGVRTEDTVVVTQTGARVLTRSEHCIKIGC